MGTKGIEIVQMDVNEILTLLNKAYADEWLAFYQYWIGATVAEGAMRGAVLPELYEHAEDEHRHAKELAERIIELGGTPLLTPRACIEEANCAFQAPENKHVRAILDQNVAGERCAIAVYNTLYNITKDADPVTARLVLKILAEEVEHEEDLQAIQKDFETGMAKNKHKDTQNRDV